MRFSFIAIFISLFIGCSNNDSAPPSVSLKETNLADSLARGQRFVDELLLMGALSDGVHKDAFVSENLKNIRRSVLGRVYLKDRSSRGVEVTEKEVVDYYLKNKNSFVTGAPSAKIYHVFFENKDRADELVRVIGLSGKKQEKNEAFLKYNVKPELVFQNSLIKGLNDAVFNKKKKQLHGPIKSSFGYHVVFVLERFSKNFVPPLELLYDEIYLRLYQKKVSLRSLNILDSLITHTPNTVK